MPFPRGSNLSLKGPRTAPDFAMSSSVFFIPPPSSGTEGTARSVAQPQPSPPAPSSLKGGRRGNVFLAEFLRCEPPIPVTLKKGNDMVEFFLRLSVPSPGAMPLRRRAFFSSPASNRKSSEKLAQLAVDDFLEKRKEPRRSDSRSSPIRSGFSLTPLTQGVK